MKKTFAIALGVATLTLSACAQHQPVVEEQPKPTKLELARQDCFKWEMAMLKQGIKASCVANNVDILKASEMEQAKLKEQMEHIPVTNENAFFDDSLFKRHAQDMTSKEALPVSEMQDMPTLQSQLQESPQSKEYREMYEKVKEIRAIQEANMQQQPQEPIPAVKDEMKDEVVKKVEKKVEKKTATATKKATKAKAKWENLP
jgi:lipoprotein